VYFDYKNTPMNGVHRNNFRYKHSVWAKYRDFIITPGDLCTNHQVLKV
jgi:hypothetical protein